MRIATKPNAVSAICQPAARFVVRGSVTRGRFLMGSPESVIVCSCNARSGAEMTPERLSSPKSIYFVSLCDGAGAGAVGGAGAHAPGVPARGHVASWLLHTTK